MTLGSEMRGMLRAGGTDSRTFLFKVLRCHPVTTTCIDNSSTWLFKDVKSILTDAIYSG